MNTNGALPKIQSLEPVNGKGSTARSLRHERKSMNSTICSNSFVPRLALLVCIALGLCPGLASATNYYSGILNVPLGAASFDIQGGILTVNGLSHSGSDGLNISAGQADALDILFLQGLLDMLKHQTCIITRATSQYAPYGVASVGGLMGGGPSPFAYADFTTLGSTQSVMQLRDASGTLLQTRPIANGEHVTLNDLFPAPQTNSIFLYELRQGPDFLCWRFAMPCLACPGPPTNIERILYINAQDVRRPARNISGLQLTSQGTEALGSITISDERFGKFKADHHAIGSGQFGGDPNGLSVSILDTNGNDGVSILVGPNQNRLKAEWNELDAAGTALPGATLTLSADGNFLGTSSQMLGSMKIQKTATGMSLVNDFTGIGSASAWILVMHEGVQVASFPLSHNTPLNFTGGWPRSATVGPRQVSPVPPYGPICFYEDWPIDVSIPIAGGSISGNQIRVLIDDVPQSFDKLSDLNLQLGGLPQIQLTGEEETLSGMIFDGLAQAPLGQATLQTDATGNTMFISGVSSNGNDGVRIYTGGGEGGTFNLGKFNPDLLPPGAFLKWRAIGPTDLELQNMTFQSTASGGAIYADFTGLGSPTVSVALYSNNYIIAYTNRLPPTTPIASFSSGGGGLPIVLNPCIFHPEDCYGVVDVSVWQPDPTGPIGSVLTLPGQGPMMCTRMQITPEYPATYFLPKYRVKATEITGLNLGTISNASQGMVYYGLEHHPLGQAEFTFDWPRRAPPGDGSPSPEPWSSGDFSMAGPHSFTVSNLGSSGNDGVDIQLQWLIGSGGSAGTANDGRDPRNSYSADWVALNPQPLPPVGSPLGLTMSAQGRLNGGGEQTLGSLALSWNGSGLQMTPDFSALGSTSQQIQLWRSGTNVTQFRNPNGTVGLTLSNWPCGVSIYPAVSNTVPPFGPICYVFRCPSPIPVTTPGGQPYLVDQIRVAADDIGASLDELTHVWLQAAGLPGLSLVNESASRTGVNYDGNQHFPLGAATLTKQPGPSQLALGNLGSGGNDGVEIAVGQAGFCEVSMPYMAPQIGNSCQFEFRASVDDVGDRTASLLSISGSAVGDAVFTADMSPLGTTHYTILALDGDTQVDIASNQPTADFSVSGNAVAISPSLRWDIQRYKCYIRVKVPKLPGDPGPVIHVRPGSGVNGDSIVVIPEDPTHTLGNQNRIFFTAVEVHPEPKMFIGEELGVFGAGHTGLGDAMLQANGQTLVVNNLGSSGDDGVTIDLGNARNFLASFAPLDFSIAQGPYPHPWFQARAFGRFGSADNHDLGSLRFTSTSVSNVQVDVDFTPVGASVHTVEVWLNGQLVQQVTGHTGIVATVSQLPAGIGKLGGNDPTVFPCYIAPFWPPVPINIGGGGPTITGDELRVLTGNPTATIGAVQSVNLQANGFDSVTIEHEGFTPALTPTLGQMSPAPGGGLQLTVPTAFGYSYNVETVNALGPQPSPWLPYTTFFGDGSVKVIPVPATSPEGYFRLRVQ
jgi:hypothetical protein